jgi:hypothetical protein
MAGRHFESGGDFEWLTRESRSDPDARPNSARLPAALSDTAPFNQPRSTLPIRHHTYCGLYAIASISTRMLGIAKAVTTVLRAGLASPKNSA